MKETDVRPNNDSGKIEFSRSTTLRELRQKLSKKLGTPWHQIQIVLTDNNNSVINTLYPDDAPKLSLSSFIPPENSSNVVKIRWRINLNNDLHRPATTTDLPIGPIAKPNNHETPKELRDPITHSMMDTPVIASDQLCYDLTTLQRCKFISPFTRERITFYFLDANRQAAITAYKSQQGTLPAAPISTSKAVQVNASQYKPAASPCPFDDLIQELDTYLAQRKRDCSSFRFFVGDRVNNNYGDREQYIRELKSCLGAAKIVMKGSSIRGKISDDLLSKIQEGKNRFHSGWISNRLFDILDKYENLLNIHYGQDSRQILDKLYKV